MSDSTANDCVLFDVDGAVATVTLNRPAAMNSLTAAMKVEAA